MKNIAIYDIYYIFVSSFFDIIFLNIFIFLFLQKKTTRRIRRRRKNATKKEYINFINWEVTDDLLES